MAWTLPRTWTTGEVVTASIGNSAWRDNLRFLKGMDGTISLDANIKGGTGAGTFYFEYEDLTSAQIVAVASATAGRLAYGYRVFHVSDGTAWRDIPVVPTGTTGQIIVTVGSGTYGLGTAPASADAGRFWQTGGSASSGTWAAAALGNQAVINNTLGSATITTSAFVGLAGYSGSVVATGSRTIYVSAKIDGVSISIGGQGEMRILKNAGTVLVSQVINNAPASDDNGLISVFDTLAASATGSYAIQARAVSGTLFWGDNGTSTGQFTIVGWN